jgi:hypothetical protein
MSDFAAQAYLAALRMRNRAARHSPFGIEMRDQALRALEAQGELRKVTAAWWRESLRRAEAWAFLMDCVFSSDPLPDELPTSPTTTTPAP